MDDKSLITQIRKGNTLAFKQLFDKHYRPLCVYAINFTNSKDTAEEIVQIVFVDFWNKRDIINVHTSLKSYLYKMAYHQFLMSLRKKNKETTVLEELKYKLLQDNNSPTAQELEHKYTRLQSIINDLPERCQDVLKLKMEGLKYKEIAETLNLSVKTVESQMRIAFIKIRDAYKDDFVLFLTFIDN
ncbi:RNA polymerase sigma-70 factor [Bizionia saleffrena]|uniref:RNA polymerase sigma-70 factor n=1 Tax=Bizionia saleffrena TaxID=291189 RepID=A0A8H2QKG4_9FLAO|nr:RNA polymerase sigma-70 factor [Bizionia saleffrena]TYB78169.1 RNA polymerase sigma-70 factor [Bizionia saleffrena]